MTGWKTLDGQPVNLPFEGTFHADINLHFIDCLNPDCQERFAVIKYTGDGTADHSCDLDGVFSAKLCPFCGRDLDYPSQKSLTPGRGKRG